MAATSKPRIIVFKADGAIAKGQPVKFGSDNDHVAAATAASDKSFGIAQNAAVNAGDKVEVAIAGGGAKALAAGTISAGDFLVPAASGVVSSTNNGDRGVAIAMRSAVSGDIFWAEVAPSIL
jgi:hypothetical protein